MTSRHATVSVIVPTRNSERTLLACLTSIRAQSYTGVELIVVDNSSTDDTPRIAADLADRVATWGPERSAQRNRGERLASGDFLYFCDSDMRLEPDVVAQAVAIFTAEHEVGAIVVPELSFGEGFWAGCRSLEKRLYLGDRSVEAARIFRRAAFQATGGYDEEMTGGEDYDLPDAIALAGWGTARTTSVAWHDEGRVQLRVVFAKKRYYGRGLPRWASHGVGRDRLFRSSLVGHPFRLLRDPVHTAGLVMLKATDGAGLLAGALSAPRDAPR